VERPNRLAFFQRQIIEYARKFHDHTFRPRGCLRKSQWSDAKSTKDIKRCFLLRSDERSAVKQNGGIASAEMPPLKKLNLFRTRK
jgi:hypothetical protein